MRANFETRWPPFASLSCWHLRRTFLPENEQARSTTVVWSVSERASGTVHLA